METRTAEIVQNSFKKLENWGDQAAETYFAELFAIDPSLRASFGDDLSAHRARFFGSLGVMVNALHRSEKIAQDIESMAAHSMTWRRAENYAHVGNALLRMLKKGLGSDYTPEVYAAWYEAYRIFARRMQEAVAAQRDTRSDAQIDSPVDTRVVTAG